MATNIGIVKFINGTVTAKSADGQIRTLKEGDIVFAGDVVMTGVTWSSGYYLERWAIG